MMRCPLCLDSPLEPKFVRGVEVDICPKCRGIWLDRGEIDKLGDDGPPLPPPPAPAPRSGDRDDDRRYRDDDRQKKGKKRKSKAKRLADLLDDILD